MPYVVESQVEGTDGLKVGTARVYVMTEIRALEITAAAPGRTYREISLDDMPDRARTNMLRAHDPR